MLLIIIFLFLLLHYLFFLNNILKGLRHLNPCTQNKIPDEFISIIIPFRNESENILKCLEGISAQNYPRDKYEVIFINDFSEDDSFEKIINSERPKNIKVLDVPEDYSINAHKKRAVRFGIENSTGGIIVATDADCFHGKDWLNTLLKCMDEKTGFVSGPVEFIDTGSFFGNLQKLEFAGLVLTGAGLIGINKPTICNAANIAYRRKAFEAVKGFNDQMNLSSGDDELLMQKIRKETDYCVKFCINKKAIVKTQPNKNVKQFYNQRKRWASKGLFYADKFLVVKLIMIFLFYLSLPVEFVLSFFKPQLFLPVLLLSITLKIYFEFNIMKKGIGFLFKEDLLKYFITGEFIHIFYIIIAGISGLSGNFAWKGRRVKR